MRKVGWLMVGLGLLVAVAGHYLIYSAPWRSDASYVSFWGAMAGLCLAIIGLLLIQSRS